jgi:dTDP-4-amino-4,6-dideoxygalactose transaminase
VFGNPCNIDAIEAIAKKYNLKVIYDAAHCFGVTHIGKSIFESGDISTCSFHATKLFHTGEGGALFTKDPNLFHQCFYSHNFGHNGPLDFHGIGINGKISELQAAMGLAVLPHMEAIYQGRAEAVTYYNEHLDWNKLQKMQLREGATWNASYYPILFENEAALLLAQKKLNETQIFPRRYFYPSLNTVKFSNGECMPISESVASRILCLPLYKEINQKELNKICLIINQII